MHKSATKCNETICKWCKNKHGASKIIDTFETYQAAIGRAYLGRPDSELGEFYVQNVRRKINFVIEKFSVWRRLRPVTWPSLKRFLAQISGKSQFDSNKVFSCILGNFYTSKCTTRTLCTFATISRLFQINYKSATKCRQNI
jgi:hypothetical protein